MTIRAIATFANGGWEIEFPDGVPGLSAAYTCTFDPDNTKEAAVHQVRDLVATHHRPRVRFDDVTVNMRWRNEDAYQRWFQRQFGRRDTFEA